MSYSHPASRGKRDANAAAIADALVEAGCSVVDIGMVGDGVPDLLVGLGGATFLMEVKSLESNAHRAKGPVPYAEYLTDDQVAFLSTWRGCPVRIVTTPGEALAEVGMKAITTGGTE